LPIWNSRRFHLTCQDGVLSYLDVVGDLDEVVDLGPAPDTGLAEGRPIDRAVGADFHVILDDDGAGLGDFLMSPILAFDIAEAVRSDNHAAVKNDIVSDTDVFADGDVRIDDAVLADPHPWKDRHQRKEDRPVPDLGLVPDHRQGPDGDVPSDFGGGRDHGCGCIPGPSR